MDTKYVDLNIESPIPLACNNENSLQPHDNISLVSDSVILEPHTFRPCWNRPYLAKLGSNTYFLNILFVTCLLAFIIEWTMYIDPLIRQFFSLYVALGMGLVLLIELACTDSLLLKLIARDFEFYFIIACWCTAAFGSFMSNVQLQYPPLFIGSNFCFNIICGIVVPLLDAAVKIPRTTRMCGIVLCLFGAGSFYITLTWIPFLDVSTDTPLFSNVPTSTPRYITKVALLNYIIFMLKALYNFRKPNRLMFSQIHLSVITK